MHLAILSIGSAGILWSMLDFDLDIRGANLFIRPFHAIGLLATVLITAVVFLAFLRLGRSIIGRRPALQTLLYVATLITIWAFALPLGDWRAEQLERSQKTPYQVGDTGYGWYYWDDSGMGGDPMTIGHILRPAILIPVLPILWLTFCYLVLRLQISPHHTSHDIESKKGEQNAPSNGGQRPSLNSGFHSRHGWPRRSPNYSTLLAMKHILGSLSLILFLATASAMADDGEAFYTPHSLDPARITQRLIDKITRPNHVYAELAGSKVVAGYSLLFRAVVDDRPLVVDECLICAEATLSSGVREWWLMRYFRHPYGRRVGDGEWTLCQQRGVDSDHTLRRLTVRPTSKDIRDYMTWANWAGNEFVGFKDIQNLCFYSDWKKLTHEDAPKLEGTLPWPAKD